MWTRGFPLFRRKPEVCLNSGTVPHLPLHVSYHVEDTEKQKMQSTLKEISR